MVQLNYQLISQDAHVHRSIAQRLITEMLQRLAMHIVAGHAIQVCTAVKLGTVCTGQFTSNSWTLIQLQQLLSVFCIALLWPSPPDSQLIMMPGGETTVECRNSSWCQVAVCAGPCVCLECSIDSSCPAVVPCVALGGLPWCW